MLGQDGLIYYSSTEGSLQILSQTGELQPTRNFNFGDLWDLGIDSESNLVQIYIYRGNPFTIRSLITGDVGEAEYVLEKFDANDQLLWSYNLGTTYRYLQNIGENGEVFIGVDNDLLMFEP